MTHEDPTPAGPDGPRCPGEASLAAWAAAPASRPDVALHVAACPRCGRRARRLREDEAFAARFAAAITPEQPAPARPAPPDLPGYTITGELGRGGQGVVYAAVQESTRRRVALKSILSGPSASQREAARFEREVEIAASLRHPSIVTVYEARRVQDGRLVVAMELVEGVPLSQWAATRGSRGRERIALVRDLARAVQYAHARGVIHRDLKPANVLVDRGGQVHILDFGLARWGTDGTARDVMPAARRTPPGIWAAGGVGASMAGEFQGTPAYAAPEQFDGEGRADVRTDVYALGVILHELLTGRRPFADGSGDLHSIARRKKSGPLARRGGNAHDTQGLTADAAAIIGKATQTDPDHRYRSAAALADDLDATLTGGVVSARTQRLYRAVKLVRRHRLAAALTLGLVGGLALVTVLVVGHNRTLADERRRLTAALQESSIAQARALARAGDRLQAERLLWGGILARPLAGNALDEALHADAESRRLIWAMLEVMGPRPCVGIAQLQGRQKPAGDRDGTLRLLGHDGVLREFSLPSLAPSAPDRRVLEADEDAALEVLGPWAVCASADAVRCYDLSTARLTATFNPPGLEPWLLPSPGHRHVLARTRNGDLWLLPLPDLTPARRLEGARGRSIATTFSPATGTVLVMDRDKKVVAYGTDDGLARPGDPRWTQGLSAGLIVPVPDSLSRITESPSGRLLAAVDGRDLLLLTASGGAARSPRQLNGASTVASFSPSERWLVAHSNGDPTILMMNTPTMELAAEFPGHDGWVRMAALTGDEKLMVTLDSANVLRAWPTPGADWRREIPDSQAAHQATFSPEGALWLTLSDGRLAREPAWGGGPAARFPTDLRPARITAGNPEGRFYLAGNGPGVEVYEHGPHGPPARVLEVPEAAEVFTMELSPDGSRLAAGTASSMVRVWRTRDGSVQAERTFGGGRVRSVRWLPDASRLLAAVGGGQVHILDPADLSTRSLIPADERQVRAAVPSPNGTVLATLGDERAVKFWTLPDGKPLAHAARTGADPFAAAFHPSGRVLAVSDRSGVVSMVDVELGEILATFRGRAPVMTVAFSPDGRLLAVAGGDSAEVWDFGQLAAGLEVTRAFWKAKAENRTPPQAMPPGGRHPAGGRGGADRRETPEGQHPTSKAPTKSP